MSRAEGTNDGGPLESEPAAPVADPVVRVPEEAPPAPAEVNAPPPDPLALQYGPLRVKLSLDAVFQQSAVTGSWWNLSESFAPDANYKPDRPWAESWIKPGIRVDAAHSEDLAFYSGVSYVGSANIGRDVFEQGNRGQWTVEDAYLGTKIALEEGESSLDLSYGRQPYKIGTGMLIAVGAQNGFERGATTTFARRAWEQAGIARYTRGAFSIDGFYLDPNELRSSDTFTRLAGAKAEWNPDANRSLGIAYINVFESIFPYVAAPVTFLENGRQGLNTVHVFGRWNPLPENLPGWFIAGDFAHQWNDRINMSADAYNAETGYTFSEIRYTPKLAYSYRLFGGDNPSTSRFEKFDPLYYEGAPPLWATGGNGSFNFLNSNLVCHRASMNFTITPRDFFTFYYWHIRADYTDSPLQFGQAGRIDVSGGEPRLTSGVTDAHLADDLYFEYTRAISANVYFTGGVAVSVPGKGLRELVPNTRTWVGGLANVTVKF